jgi:hypothetical protein
VRDPSVLEPLARNAPAVLGFASVCGKAKGDAMWTMPGVIVSVILILTGAGAGIDWLLGLGVLAAVGLVFAAMTGSGNWSWAKKKDFYDL